MISLSTASIQLENAAPYLFLFLIWIAVAAVSLWRGIAPRVRGTGEIDSRRTATGAILLVWGIAMLLVPHQGEEWLSVVVICGAGVMMTFIGAVSIRDARRCTVYVSAHIVRHRVTRSKHGRHYYAVLRYRYEGQEYESECFQSLTHWQARDEYPEGSDVWAYICPEKPMLCALDNTVRISYVISIAVGIALTVGGIGFALGGGF